MCAIPGDEYAISCDLCAKICVVCAISCDLYAKTCDVCVISCDVCAITCDACEAKEKYRGVFEIQKFGDKTSSGEIGLNIRTHASPKVGQDQVSGGVSILCWHAAPVAYVL